MTTEEISVAILNATTISQLEELSANYRTFFSRHSGSQEELMLRIRELSEAEEEELDYE